MQAVAVGYTVYLLGEKVAITTAVVCGIFNIVVVVLVVVASAWAQENPICPHLLQKKIMYGSQLQQLYLKTHQKSNINCIVDHLPSAVIA